MNEATRERASPQIGDRMPDGTIYAGISPDTGNAMFAAPADASRTMGWLKAMFAGPADPSRTMTWKDAMRYAATFEGHGHKDWRLPTKAELDVLFNNRAAIDGLNESTSYSAGWYWSSTEFPYYPDYAWVERFSDGGRNWFWKGNEASVRPVRSGP